jgi:hypothetical protein
MTDEERKIALDALIAAQDALNALTQDDDPYFGVFEKVENAIAVLQKTKVTR